VGTPGGYSGSSWITRPHVTRARAQLVADSSRHKKKKKNIVSHEGVKVDPNKIKAMMDWPIPKTLKNIRGFLSLTGYYRKFVLNYGRITTPLTALTKKDAFSWTLEETKSFEQLKEVMCKAPVLTTPDFTKTFTVECDALRNGIGAVLMQEGRPLAFES
jgi:hypothetical protein